MATANMSSMAYGRVLAQNSRYEVQFLPFTSDDPRPFKIIDSRDGAEITSHRSDTGAIRAMNSMNKKKKNAVTTAEEMTDSQLVEGARKHIVKAIQECQDRELIGQVLILLADHAKRSKSKN